MTTTPDPTPRDQPGDLGDAVDELAGLGIPVMFMIDSVPVNEAELDAGVMTAMEQRAVLDAQPSHRRAPRT